MFSYIDTPPYGHGGEVALNYMMRESGDFEGNAQTFRIVTSLEPYTEHHGMNLSRRTLLGLLKYPALLSQVRADKHPEAVVHQRQLKAKDWAPAKGVYDCDKSILDWVLEPLSSNDRHLLSILRDASGTSPYQHHKTRFKSLDCSIMELADDIAYGVHDLEDAIVLGMVNRSQWMELAVPQLSTCGDEWFRENIDSISTMLFSGQHFKRKDAIGGMVNALLTNVQVSRVDANFDSPLLAYNAYLESGMAQALDVLKQFVSRYVIHNPKVQRIEYKGQQIIMDLFEALSADPERLLPESTQQRWRLAEQDSHQGMRVICDYISAMTDAYAQKIHQELFSSGSY